MGKIFRLMARLMLLIFVMFYIFIGWAAPILIVSRLSGLYSYKTDILNPETYWENRNL
jgi:hypothetical protein